ncbi:MAG: hypothetical protein FWE21_03510 [Defluviitaleaceae bacterium]|nr:hypothetical protein [Defluviitaleaceae bacterium]
MDDNQKDHWLKGFIWFCALILCIISLFNTPDGQALFVGLMGLLGIPPSIPMGGGSTLHVLGIIPIGLGIFFIAKMRRYWKGYSTKFHTLKPAVFKGLPLTVLITLFVLTQITPSPVDRIYFAAMSRREGFDAVAYTPDFNHGRTEIRWQTHKDEVTYTYTFTIRNFADTPISFRAVAVLWGGKEIPIRHHDDDAVFDLGSRHTLTRLGTFTAPLGDKQHSGGTSTISLVLIDEDGVRHYPRRLVRLPQF